MVKEEEAKGKSEAKPRTVEASAEAKSWEDDEKHYRATIQYLVGYEVSSYNSTWRRFRANLHTFLDTCITYVVLLVLCVASVGRLRSMRIK